MEGNPTGRLDTGDEAAMTTRCTIQFRRGVDNPPTAIIYRHGDGYPKGAGRDLLRFLEVEAEQNKTGRFGSRRGDAAYLAARYLVFQAVEIYGKDATFDIKTMERKEIPFSLDRLLTFGSTGILNEDTDDIQYRYIVDCNEGGEVWVERPDGTRRTLVVNAVETDLLDGEVEDA